MHRRNVLVVTRQPELAHKLKAVFSNMDVEARFVNRGVFAALQECSSLGFDLDLIVVDGDHETLADLNKLEDALVEDDAPSLLLIVAAEALASMRLPVRLTADFVTRTAPDIEYQVRLHRLIWPGEEAGSTDFIRVGSMTLNLATYQVKVDGAVLDLTYLEYALLAFLITHPGRTYSRDALLRRVWGFEYYGGSRTVDVHVRRVRAKLGPDLAHHLETIRGVGYLWNR
ncbi:MAG: winged helix-turn-helix domain-containing protein [Coriobacteriales bacterium]|jgi:DNA-binding response OmpR family regulator|nr:winged helix-turn-helix domain-containing protein [Coriobacteriales bacterium]